MTGDNGIETLAVDSAINFFINHDRWPARAVAKAIDRLQANVFQTLFLCVSNQVARSDRLARLCLANFDDVLLWFLGAEIGIEADDTEDVGAGLVEGLCYYRNHGLFDAAEVFMYGVQRWHQTPLLFFEWGDYLSYRLCIFAQLFGLFFSVFLSTTALFSMQGLTKLTFGVFSKRKIFVRSWILRSCSRERTAWWGRRTGNMEEKFKYTAFISYSHADQAVVKWLHRALESYRVPVKLVGKETPAGKVPGKFKPIFRDRDDLSAAASLTNTIKEALRQSKFLIVVCSPNAARSTWVEKEIQEFRKMHGQDQILCLIADADPSGKVPIFPPALTESAKGKPKFEPIAADMRASGDGKRMAKLKLISGLLGVELDTLVQRDAKRRQIQMGVMAATFSIATVVLSVLLYMAVEARKEAEVNRQRAEDLVGFMLGDLHDKLAPIGSLQLMDTISIRALDYYSSIEPEQMDLEALRRRSQILLMLGETQELRGNTDAARDAFQEAYVATGELVKRDPENADLIFDHAQTVYWLGFSDLRLKNYVSAEDYFKQYANYSEDLLSRQPDNQDYKAEVGYAYTNLGTVQFHQGKFKEAQGDFEKALDIQINRAKESSYSKDIQFDLGQAYAWLSDSEKELGNFTKAEDLRLRELSIYSDMLNKDGSDRSVLGALGSTYRGLGSIALLQGHEKKSVEYFDRSIAIFQNLSAYDPENTEWKENQAGVYVDKAKGLIARRKYSDAEAILQRALTLSSDLLKINPDFSNWVLIQFKAKFQLAEIEVKDGKKKAGLDAAQALANDFYQKVPPETRTSEMHFLSAQILDLLAEAYRRNKDDEAARDNWRTVVRILQPFEATGGLVVAELLPKARERANDGS